MKGQWKTMEAVMAGIVILVFVAGLSSIHTQQATPVPAHGQRALFSVYEKGDLRSHAAAYDLAAIDAEVSATGYLAGYNHSVAICNATTCVGSPPDKEQVWASSVLLSGDQQYQPAEVILYIFRD